MLVLFAFILSALVTAPFFYQVRNKKNAVELTYGNHLHTHFLDVATFYKLLPTIGSMLLVFIIYDLPAFCMYLLVIYLFTSGVGWIFQTLCFKYYRALYLQLYIEYGSVIVLTWVICIYRLIS